jgi:endonuclease/exonuclease/phosphatase family metal-dependent hydrolase
MMRMSRGPLLILAATLVMLVGVQARAQAPATGAASTLGKHKAAETLTVKVLSYNVWGVPYIAPERAERIEEIGRQVAELAPDLVAMQEVWDPRDAELLGGPMAAAGLTHTHLFGSHDQSSGLWIASRYPIEQVHFEPFELGKKVYIPWHVDYMAEKGLAVVRVTTPVGPLVLANTHLQAPYSVGNYDYLQMAQAMQAADTLFPVGAGAPPDAELPPLILAGDINAEPGTLPFRLLADGAGLTPTANSRVDSILVRHGSSLRAEARSVRTMFTDPVRLKSGTRRTLSDHDALFAELELTRCDGCVAAGADVGAWRTTASDAVRFLHDDAAWTARFIWLERLLALLLPVLAVWVAFLSRRRLRAWQRWSMLGASMSVLAFSGWLAYLGWDFGPWKLEVLSIQSTRMQHVPSVPFAIHR